MDPKNMQSETVERRALRGATAHHYFIPASYQAFQILRAGFVLAPIIAGVDKFFHYLTNWNMYLSPKITALTSIPADTFMRAVGVVEVAAGLLVAVSPRIGGLVVAVWLCGIIVNLLSIPGYYDVALRDLGLAMGALALSRLSMEFERYRRA